MGVQDNVYGHRVPSVGIGTLGSAGVLDGRHAVPYHEPKTGQIQDSHVLPRYREQFASQEPDKCPADGVVHFLSCIYSRNAIIE